MLQCKNELGEKEKEKNVEGWEHVSSPNFLGDANTDTYCLPVFNHSLCEVNTLA